VVEGTEFDPRMGREYIVRFEVGVVEDEDLWDVSL
jgi:hypothetical protein